MAGCDKCGTSSPFGHSPPDGELPWAQLAPLPWAQLALLPHTFAEPGCAAVSGRGGQYLLASMAKGWLSSPLC